MGSGSLRERMGKHFDLMGAHAENSIHFLSRAPKVLDRYDNLMLPFTKIVWIMVVASLVCLSIVFGATYAAYSSHYMLGHSLHREGFSTSTFPVYTLCRIKDPASVPWFRHKLSTGRFLAFQYTVFCFMLSAMYSSNLKAQLVVVGYEKPIDTVQDVLDNGKTPWIMLELGYLS